MKEAGGMGAALLPCCTPSQGPSLTVVVDLDGTLCSGTDTRRPGWDELVRALRDTRAEVVVWTASQATRRSAEAFADMVRCACPAHIIYADYPDPTWSALQGWTAEGGWDECAPVLKDLRWLGRPVSNILVIEDSWTAVRLQLANAVIVDRFTRVSAPDRDPTFAAVGQIVRTCAEAVREGSPVTDTLAAMVSSRALTLQGCSVRRVDCSVMAAAWWARMGAVELDNPGSLAPQLAAALGEAPGDLVQPRDAPSPVPPVVFTCMGRQVRISQGDRAGALQCAIGPKVLPPMARADAARDNDGDWILILSPFLPDGSCPQRRPDPDDVGDAVGVWPPAEQVHEVMVGLATLCNAAGVPCGLPRRCTDRAQELRHYSERAPACAVAAAALRGGARFLPPDPCGTFVWVSGGAEAPADLPHQLAIGPR
eukprot:TRINITY_DN41010_c0_g1_i1.p1 TRINITY_DN41010_c0_g1~~TRINITY_DN41010_c0_g1_i1.p1  ORF type:complete len:445 (+),score=65.30 TRINITY_DN41010_c0_g1_i1:63-1337(+)